MEQVTLSFTANGQTLTQSGGTHYASDTISYIGAVFELGDNWDSFDLVGAIWFNDFNTIATVLDSDGTCTVPTEVLKRKGKVYVNLVGSVVDGDTVTDRLTTYPIPAICIDAKARVSGSETAEITASQFEQFVSQVQDEVATVTGMTATATTLAEGSSATASWDGTNGVLTLGIPTGATGATGNGISSVVLNGDYTLTITFTDGTSYTTTSIRGEKGDTGDTGNGIQSIYLTGSTGTDPVVNEYTILFTDGSTTTFSVTNGETGATGATGATGETGNGIDSITLVSSVGLVDTYQILMTDSSTYDFTVTNGADAEIDTEHLEDALAVYAMDKGSYDTDKTPYLLRASGGSANVGVREYDTLIGGTVAWNQYANPLADGTYANVTLSVGANGVYSCSGVANGGFPLMQQNLQHLSGHKYLMLFDFIANPNNLSLTIGMGLGNPYWVNVSTSKAQIYTNTYSTKTSIFSASGLNFDGAKFRLQIFDLTQMFGSTIADYIYNLETNNAGDGVAWFKSLFPNSYYAYNAGELMSVNASEHVTVGFNQWDEVWEVGTFSLGGVPVPAGNAIRSKNFCPCVGGATYYMTCSKTDGGYQNKYYLGILWFDANKNYISIVYNNNGTVVAPANAKFFKITTNTSTVIYGATYNNDICINISNASRNGEYEAYSAHSYTLDSDLTLRGIPKLDGNNSLYYDGDTYEADGTVTRKYGIVDMGTLNWAYRTSGTIVAPYMYSPITSLGIKRLGYFGSVVHNIKCSKYVTVARNETDFIDGTICADGDSELVSQIQIKDSAYTDADAFKSAMSGVYLVYELATATTETADSFTAPQVVDADGTESYTDYAYSQGTRDVAVPVGHSTDYPVDILGKSDMLADIPNPPTTDGTYSLQLTVSSGDATYLWV